MKREIGFEFDFEETEEFTIYAYLCGKFVRRNKLNKIKNKSAGTSYRNWSNYIYSKYEKASEESLIEFTKYLNYMLNRVINVKKVSETILYPAIIAAFVSGMIEIIMNIDKSEGMIVYVFTVLILSAFIMLPIAGVIAYIDYSFNKNSLKVSMYKDYKKEIKKLIKSKKNSHQE